MNTAIRAIVAITERDCKAAQAKLQTVSAAVKFLIEMESKRYVEKTHEQQEILRKAQWDADEAQRHYQAAAEAASTLN